MKYSCTLITLLLVFYASSQNDVKNPYFIISNFPITSVPDSSNAIIVTSSYKETTPRTTIFLLDSVKRIERKYMYKTDSSLISIMAYEYENNLLRESASFRLTSGELSSKKFYYSNDLLDSAVYYSVQRVLTANKTEDYRERRGSYHSYSYTEDGNLMYESFNESSGDSLWGYIYQYNSDGYLISRKTISKREPHDTFGEKEEKYTYSEMGQLVSQENYLPDGSLSVKFIYHYNDDGSLSKIDIFNKSDEKTEVTLFHYRKLDEEARKNINSSRSLNIHFN